MRRRAIRLCGAVLLATTIALVLTGCGGGGSGTPDETGLSQAKPVNPFAGRYCGIATQNGQMAMLVVVRVLTSGVAQVAVYGPKLEFLCRASGTVSGAGAASWTVAAKDDLGATISVQFTGSFTGSGETLAATGTWTGFGSGTRAWQLSVIQTPARIANSGSWDFTFPSTGGGGTYKYTEAFGVLAKYQGVSQLALFLNGPSTFVSSVMLAPADAVIVVSNPGQAAIGTPYTLKTVNVMLSKWRLDWFRNYKPTESGAASTITFSARTFRVGGTISGTMHADLKSLGSSPALRFDDVALQNVRVMRDYR